jgi:hypothetical protein
VRRQGLRRAPANGSRHGLAPSLGRWLSTCFWFRQLGLSRPLGAAARRFRRGRWGTNEHHAASAVHLQELQGLVVGGDHLVVDLLDAVPCRDARVLRGGAARDQTLDEAVRRARRRGGSWVQDQTDFAGFEGNRVRFAVVKSAIAVSSRLRFFPVPRSGLANNRFLGRSRGSVRRQEGAERPAAGTTSVGRLFSTTREGAVRMTNTSRLQGGLNTRNGYVPSADS